MALKNKRDAILQCIRASKPYLDHNNDLFKIHEGGLLPYITAIMQAVLNVKYFSTIKHLIMPINILRRYIDKVSKAYAKTPTRKASVESAQDQIEQYVKWFKMKKNGPLADRWGNLFKGYAWEIFIHKGHPRLRTLAFNQFLPISEDPVDPMNVTIMVKFLGERLVTKHKLGPRGGKTKETEARKVDVYYVYTDDEFDAFDSEGDAYITPEIEKLQGKNPFGTIPFVYGNRSLSELLPTQDTDVLPMVKIIPILCSDLAGAITYQCFSIVYTIDVAQGDLSMSPNAKWDLKSDEKSDKEPKVGTIKPEVDIESVMGYIMRIFTLWLETKGVRVGSTGTVDKENFASGVSKVIDEMDTYEIRKESQEFLVEEEAELWRKTVIVNNFLFKNNQDDRTLGLSLMPEDLIVTTEFEVPKPAKSRMDDVKESAAELDAGTSDQETEIRRLHPEWDDAKIASVIKNNPRQKASEAPAFPPKEEAA
jgi:hypothetical protein